MLWSLDCRHIMVISYSLGRRYRLLLQGPEDQQCAADCGGGGEDQRCASGDRAQGRGAPERRLPPRFQLRPQAACRREGRARNCECRIGAPALMPITGTDEVVVLADAYFDLHFHQHRTSFTAAHPTNSVPVQGSLLDGSRKAALPAHC